MDRVILHCDLNAFYASVECIGNPQLKNVPMAVCGDPRNRHGIVLAKNELAKAFNIKTGEAIWQAKAKCPALVLAAPHHRLYSEYSKKVNQIYLRYTSQVEPFGIDESWLDVTGSSRLFGSGFEIAERLRREVREELSLTISIGVSFNKVFAKLGSDYKKPDATTVISRDNYKQLLYPLPVSDMLFVGRAAEKLLFSAGIKTIGDLAAADPALLRSMLHKQGGMLHAFACGEDDSPVLEYDSLAPAKSIGNGMTFKRDISTLSDVKLAVYTLADKVAARMKASEVSGSTIQVTVKSADFKVIQRQAHLSEPTSLSVSIAAKALELIGNNRKLDTPIRAITIAVGNLTDQASGIQLSFFDDQDEREKRLQNTVFGLKNKYGEKIISRGSQINNDLGIVMTDS